MWNERIPKIAKLTAAATLAIYSLLPSDRDELRNSDEFDFLEQGFMVTRNIEVKEDEIIDVLYVPPPKDTSPPDLSPVSAVFPAVSGLSRRHPPLLLPGCGGSAPRALTGRDDSQSPKGLGGESEVAIGASGLCPVLGV